MAGKAAKIVGGLSVVTGIVLGIWYFLRPPAPPPGKATLYGIVTDADTGDPIGGVDVYIDGAITSTDPTGYYELAGIEPGTREVVFEKEGYDPGSTTVELTADETRELNVQMTPTGVPTPDVHATLRWDKEPPSALPCGPHGYGDVNDDGVVDSADVQLVSQYIVGAITLSAEQQIRADVNGDGIVDSADAQLISQYIVGAIDTFPVC